MPKRLALMVVQRQTAASKSTRSFKRLQHGVVGGLPIVMPNKPFNRSTHTPSFNVSLGQAPFDGAGDGSVGVGDGLLGVGDGLLGVGVFGVGDGLLGVGVFGVGDGLLGVGDGLLGVGDGLVGVGVLGFGDGWLGLGEGSFGFGGGGGQEEELTNVKKRRLRDKRRAVEATALEAISQNYEVARDSWLVSEI
ncbi:keratin, type II cytoskeletal 1-like [Manihot esculenta]|uniref:keratin, type II cytoskeletal 1-like n=1 Tax=Manihot esculenta TaxID=3983 RepID=UPI001CC80771|nr:keratin, type II cytoskeletal 1-like [Manihot esculenta]